jgi:hypothetical protein
MFRQRESSRWVMIVKPASEKVSAIHPQVETYKGLCDFSIERYESNKQLDQTSLKGCPRKQRHATVFEYATRFVEYETSVLCVVQDVTKQYCIESAIRDWKVAAVKCQIVDV